MDSAGNHIGRRTSDNFTASYGSKAALDKARRVRSTSLTFPSPVPSGLEEKSRLAPKTVAVTEVDVKVCTLDPVVGVKPMSIWATVEISAHVHSDEHPPGCLAPLDVVIILDSV